MIQIQTFNELYNFLKKQNVITNLKNFSDLAESSYTYFSELKNNRKPLTKYFVENINRKFNTEFELINSDVKDLPIITHDPNGKQIPFYNVEVFATISPAMADVVALRPDTFIHIPMFS